MNHNPLTGHFIRLEPLSLAHLPDLESHFDSSLFDYYPKGYFSAREFVEENLEMQIKGNFLPYAIVRATTGEAIGCSEFSAIDSKNRQLEIGGSWLRRNYHGSAANSEAKLLMLRHAFETLDFVRVQFTANALNRQSRAGIEKIGGQFEGILRNVKVLSDGTLRDDAYYSIIASEWPSVQKKLQQRYRNKLASQLELSGQL